MNAYAQLFYDIGEPYAAGLFEAPEKGYFYRHAVANARYLEALRPAAFEEGDLLYPCGNRYMDWDRAVVPAFATTYQVNWKLLRQKSEKAYDLLWEFAQISKLTYGWTHAAPNYKRIVKEGLSSYRERVLKQPDGEFKDGLLVLLAGIENYIRRSAAYLKEAGAPDALVEALNKVPFAAAETYYEGLVTWNLIFYLDGGGDNLGFVDDGLAHLYAGEDLTEVLHQLFSNIDAVGTWSCTIGGSYNEVTRQALRAIRNRRRPMLELKVNKDMPEDIWELAINNIKTGATNPSFYNDQGIRDMMHAQFPQIPEEELKLFVGCGCTETNLQGITRAGGTDGNVPLLLLLEKYLHAHLKEAASFEEFYEGFCKESVRNVDEHIDLVISHYQYMAQYLPNPIRTLFTDDCIEKGKDFNAGGARYTWTQTSDSGLINTIDSLAAIRELVFETQKYTPEDFLEKLTAEDPGLYQDLQHCPCFGTDNEAVDLLAREYTQRIYSVYQKKPPQDFIDGYLITEHQFLRYEAEGRLVGPTPDGRKAGEPTCDSIAAIRGKAVKGPTAMLKSAAKLPQHLALGISVLNLTLTKDAVGKALRPLVESYFAMGGIQVQVTSTSPEELLDAYHHPEKHKDLVVRVGGYSDYFINLTPALRKAVVERNVHEV